MLNEQCIKWILKNRCSCCARKAYFLGLNRLARACSFLGNVELSICLSFRIVSSEGSVDIQNLTFECFFLFAEIFPRDLRKKEKVIKHLTGEQLLSFLWPWSGKGKQMCLRISNGLFSFHQVLFISVQNAGSTSTGFTITPETAPSLHVSTVKPSHLCRPHKQVTPLPTCTTTLYKLTLYSWQSHVG